MRSIISIVSILVTALFVNPAFAFPLIKPDATIGPFPPTFTQDYNFEGIVALSNCSGSLIRFEHSQDTDRAMVLTNGHCLSNGLGMGMPRPGETVYRQPTSRRFTLLNKNADEVGTLNAVQIMYGSMTGTDVAVYQLRETYQQIMNQYRIPALTLSSKRPALNDEIEVISGYWQRGFRCAIETFVFELREDDYVMNDSIRYSRPGCEVYGGTSGSPIVAKNSRTVIGINNTGNESGGRCTMNNPCEVNEKGDMIAVRGYSYGQQTYQIYSCLAANREIDLSVAGCLLRH